MSRMCFVARCQQRSSLNEKGEKITFHNLPKEETLRTKWLRNIHRDLKYCKITKSTKVCSRHFKSTDYISLDSERPRLKANAVPTIFDWDTTINVSHTSSILSLDSQNSDPSSSTTLPLSSDSTKSTSLASSELLKSALHANISSISNENDTNNCNEASTMDEEDKLDSNLNITCNDSINCDVVSQLTSTPVITKKSTSIFARDVNFSSSEMNKSVEISSRKQSSHCFKCKTLEQKLEALLLENTQLKKELSLKQVEVQSIIETLESEKAKSQHLAEDLKTKVSSIDSIKDNNEDVYFYTGLPNYGRFKTLVTFLNPGENGDNITLWYAKKRNKPTESGLGRPRKLSPENQLFLVLMRLRLGLFTRDLSHRFGISANTVSRITITWISYMYLQLGQLCIWPTKEVIKRNMPEDFKMYYPNTRLILDATEIKCETSKSLYLQSGTYSNYKSTTTFKGLIGISPDGLVTFVSSLYTGCISDKELTERSGLLKLPFDRTDDIMADKGFTIQDLLKEKGITLNIPAFLRNKDQLDENEIEETQKIAALRIHVERRIRRIKGFHILDRAIPHTLSPIINEIWTVCALLTNFQEPLVKNSNLDMNDDLEEISVPLEMTLKGDLPSNSLLKVDSDIENDISDSSLEDCDFL